MKTKVAKIAIVILTHNALRYCRICFKSLKKTIYPECDVVVVDNDSNVIVKSYLLFAFGQKLIDRICFLNKNFLYAEGNNTGVRLTSGDISHIVLMNSDIRIRDPLWLQKMLAIHREGITSLGYASKEPWPRADGWCALIDKKVYLDYRLDENYPWWWSFTKLQARLLNDGYSVQAVEKFNTLITHFGGKSGKPEEDKNHYYNIEAAKVREWFNGKHIKVIESL